MNTYTVESRDHTNSGPLEVGDLGAGDFRLEFPRTDPTQLACTAADIPEHLDA
ncbi:hypothetical protein GCM10010177_79640 [Actinomadura citrea]|nr:hypothetical protein GCM10010177_79640 [Actinomadura citrea]